MLQKSQSIYRQNWAPGYRYGERVKSWCAAPHQSRRNATQAMFSQLY